MNNDLTVIYYTSNREDEKFEAKIRADLLKKIGNLPLISVSQKPLKDFGDNICVGNVGVSDWNIYRQLQLGCEKAKTKWVVTAEADCLYPPTGYFDFIPPDYLNEHPADYIPNYAYHYRNLWILYSHMPNFYSKHFSLCGLYANREYLLSRIYRSTRKSSKWIDGYTKPRPLFNKFNGWNPIWGKLPIINMKTGKGIRKWTGVTDVNSESLPYFGLAKDLKREYLQ